MSQSYEIQGRTAAAAPAPRCGLLRLVMVMIYDGVILAGLLIVAAAAVFPLDRGNQQAMRDPGFTAYLVAVWFTYLAWCWNRGGMTLGMRAWKVIIRDDSGRRPGLKACAVRFISSLVSAACAGLGFAWILFDRDKRSWHDRVSGTGLFRAPGSD